MQRSVWVDVIAALGIGLVVCAAVVGVAAAASDGPYAEAGLDQTVHQNQTVYLDAGGSVAPDGEIEQYEWEIETPGGETIEPACPDCVQTSFVPSEVGLYEVSVAVTDDEGRTDTDTMYVEVEEYDPPSVTIEAPSETDLEEGATVTTDASAGEEPLASLAWSVDGEHHEDADIDGETVTTELTELSFDEPGFYEVNATVVDRFGYQVTDTVEISVTDPASFEVEILDTTTFGVDEAADLDVTVEVANTGGSEDTQSVALSTEFDDADASELDEQTVTLDPGEETTLELQWSDAASTLTDGEEPLEALEAGEEPEEPTVHTADVEAASEDDEDTTAVTPEPPELPEPHEVASAAGIEEVEAAIEANITDGELEVMLIPEAAKNAPDLPEFMIERMEARAGAPLLSFMEGDEIDLAEHEAYIEGDGGTVDVADSGDLVEEFFAFSDEGELVIEFEEVERHEDDARIRFIPGEEAADEVNLTQTVNDAFEDGEITDEEIREQFGDEMADEVVEESGDSSGDDTVDAGTPPGTGSDDSGTHDDSSDDSSGPGTDDRHRDHGNPGGGIDDGGEPPHGFDQRGSGSGDDDSGSDDGSEDDSDTDRDRDPNIPPDADDGGKSYVPGGVHRL